MLEEEADYEAGHGPALLPQGVHEEDERATAQCYADCAGRFFDSPVGDFLGGAGAAVDRDGQVAAGRGFRWRVSPASFPAAVAVHLLLFRLSACGVFLRASSSCFPTTRKRNGKFNDS